MKIRKVDDKPMVIHTKEKAKAVAKETAKETAKTTAKVAAKTATKAAATAAGTAVASGVGTAIGMAAGYAAGVDISYGGATTAAAEAQGLDEAGKTVSFDELQPGDLIFYSFTSNGRYKNISHVAVYVGNGKVVEALNESLGVVYRDVASTGKIVVIGRPYHEWKLCPNTFPV